jgi:hypothetical protein
LAQNQQIARCGAIRTDDIATVATVIVQIIDRDTPSESGIHQRSASSNPSSDLDSSPPSVRLHPLSGEGQADQACPAFL